LDIMLAIIIAFSEPYNIEAFADQKITGFQTSFRRLAMLYRM